MENPTDDPREFAHAHDGDADDGPFPLNFGGFIGVLDI